jgi:hypothetical protein
MFAAGKAHYIALPPRTELEQCPVGAVVEFKGAAMLDDGKGSAWCRGSPTEQQLGQQIAATVRSGAI